MDQDAIRTRFERSLRMIINIASVNPYFHVNFRLAHSSSAQWNEAKERYRMAARRKKASKKRATKKKGTKRKAAGRRTAKKKGAKRKATKRKAGAKRKGGRRKKRKAAAEMPA